MDEFRKIDGVIGATRVSTFNVQLNSDFVLRANSASPIVTQNQGPGQGRNQNNNNNNNNVSIRLLALDSQDFSSTTWFRSDFAQESLAEMMSRLATTSDGVLVPRDILTQYDLQVGDQFGATVGTSYSMKIPTQFTIVGTYDYFPTVYKETGVTLIGNLENLYDQFGFTVPHRIWLKLAPGASSEAVMKSIAATLQTNPDTSTQDARLDIKTEQAKTERVGIFGTLSIGFLATAAMAMLGLLIYSYASLRERVYHLAMLLAVGVSRSQVVAQVVLEYTFLSLFGVGAGAFIGITASNLFVPFFRFTGEKGVIPLPPLLPVIAWPGISTLTLIFTVVIVVAEVVTITLSIRDRIGQLLKDV
jgi:ABC-type antimicrobial peptide transport system permease subunit